MSGRCGVLCSDSAVAGFGWSSYSALDVRPTRKALRRLELSFGRAARQIWTRRTGTRPHVAGHPLPCVGSEPRTPLLERL